MIGPRGSGGLLPDREIGFDLIEAPPSRLCSQVQDFQEFQGAGATYAVPGRTQR